MEKLGGTPPAIYVLAFEVTFALVFHIETRTRRGPANSKVGTGDGPGVVRRRNVKIQAKRNHAHECAHLVRAESPFPHNLVMRFFQYQRKTVRPLQDACHVHAYVAWVTPLNQEAIHELKPMRPGHCCSQPPPPAHPVFLEVDSKLLPPKARVH